MSDILLAIAITIFAATISPAVLLFGFFLHLHAQHRRSSDPIAK